MGQVNEAVAQADVDQFIRSLAQSQGVILPALKHLLETDEIRRCMSSLKLAYMAQQEGHGDPAIMEVSLRRSQVRLAVELAKHFNILLPGPEMDILDIDDIRDREMVLDGWGEPDEIYGGYPEIGLIYD